jgi:hypothetical protein
LREDETALGIEDQPVRSDLPAARLGAGVSGWRQIQPGAFALLPAMNLVRWNIGEEQIAAVFHPDRTFGPRVSAGEDFDDRVGRNQLVERGVESFDSRRLRKRRGLLAHRRGPRNQSVRRQRRHRERRAYS